MSKRKPPANESTQRPAAKRDAGVKLGAVPKRASGRPPFTLTTGWAAAILALLVVLFFNDVIVGGKTFISPDATAPAGFVRQGEASLYQDKVYPLWNPFVFLGMPSFASGTYNPLIYPPDWPLALIAKVIPLPELTWLLLYYFLGALGMFLLARAWGARPEGAILGAAAFIFAPNLVAVGAHGHGSQLVNSAYLPIMLWLATRWMRNGRWSDLGWLALAGGFQFLRGHVQICFYTWMAIGLYVFVESAAALRNPRVLTQRLMRAGLVFAAAALAFGIAGFYNIPLRDYAQYSIRGGSDSGGGVGFAYATQWSLAPFELPSVVIPSWTGFGGQAYWGGMPFTDYPNAYVGLVTVLLAVPAFLGRGSARVFALVLAAVAFGIAFGRHAPFYGLVYDHLPLFNKFRVPVMVIVLFQVAAAAGLAWGWSTIFDRPDKGKPTAVLDRILMVAGAVLGVALLAGIAGQDALRGAYMGVAASLSESVGRPLSAELAAYAYRDFIGDLSRGALIGLFAVATAWLARRKKLPVGVATVIVLALLLIELWPVSARVMAPVIGDPARRTLQLGSDDVVEYLEQAGPVGSFRVLPVQDYQSNRYSGFGIATLGGYHAAKPRLYQDFYDAGLVNNPYWWRLLNIRYIVLDRPIEPAPPGLVEVHRGSGFVYENLDALPRVTLLERYRVVSPAVSILDSIAAGLYDTGGTVLLEDDPGLTLGPIAGGRASIVSYRVNDVTIEVDTPGPALLRLADLWYPDWTATVDGDAAPILKADYLLRAVAVPAGKHQVVFRFTSPPVRTGLTVSIVSIIVVIALLGIDFFIRRRRIEPTPPATEAA